MKMKVPVVGSGATTSGKIQNKKNSGVSFSSYLSESETAEPVSAAAAGGVSSVNSLFMLQEVEEDEERTRKKAVARGQTMLEYLDEVRIELLTGSMSDGLLKRLEGLIKQWRENSLDPKLEEIISEIELRSQVELAKRKII
jgi:hypothetical protein